MVCKRYLSRTVFLALLAAIGYGVLLFLTGMANIRDVIPFPRTPGSAEF